MVDARLFSYVQQQLQAGYDASTIRNYLLQNRYPLNEVDAVFQAIQQGQIKSQISDDQLKNILKQLQPEKKEFKIKRI